MVPLGRVPNSLLRCLCFLICAVFLSPEGVSFAVGDLAVVVERVADSSVDKCKYCGRHIKPGEIHKDAQIVIEGQLRNQLTERDIGISMDKKNSRYVNVLVYRFEERRGGNFAVEKPAGVGFHMHLMEGSTVGKIFVFDEDQQALSQNVLNVRQFLKRGAKWLTVEQLSQEGIEAGLDYFLQGLE
jgi:hypothetical protein